MAAEPQRDDRFHEGVGGDQRTPFQRDRDRVLYCQQLRRLSGVTQVARADESYLYHDRLTHSLKVAQVGRRLAEYLIRRNEGDITDFLNPDVVETAALAHDLGHPPWGHVVEKELDSLIRGTDIQDGFEGNPQSFRIVTQTAVQSEKYPGLNLTRASLNAILKYPWKRTDNGGLEDYRHEEGYLKKWGCYNDETEYFKFARKLGKGHTQSLEAQIMDWADDLTYGVHDVTDFYKSGLIPLDQLLEGTPERERFIDAFYKNTDYDEYDIDAHEFFEWLNEYFATDELLTPFTSSMQEKYALKELSSALIDRYLGINRDDFSLLMGSNGPHLRIDPEVRLEVELLKYLTIYYVLEDSNLMAQQYGQREMVRTIFEAMVENIDTRTRFSNMIPSPYREQLNDMEEGELTRDEIRIITDMIANMTEKQASQFYKRITGQSPGSLQDKII